MYRAATRWLFCTALAWCLVLAISSCSSSKSATASKSSTTQSQSSTATSSAPLTSSSSATGTPADAATLAAVKRAYATFFNPASPPAKIVAALQHGTKFQAALAANQKLAVSQKLSAAVNSVSLLNADVAKVVWTLSGNGTPLLPNTSGFAVRENGVWKVAAQTFCALLSLNGAAPATCSTASLTALPK